VVLVAKKLEKNNGAKFFNQLQPFLAENDFVSCTQQIYRKKMKNLIFQDIKNLKTPFDFSRQDN